MGLYAELGLDAFTELPRLPRLPRLGEPLTTEKDKYDTEIANQLLRLAAVGEEPPPQVEAGSPSLLTSLSNALTYLGRKTREGLLGTESGSEWAAQHGVTGPTEQAVLGFLIDLATDPLSYLSLGGTAAGNVALKVGLPFITRSVPVAAIPGSGAVLQAVKRAAARIPGVERAGRWLSTTYVPWSLSTTEQQALHKGMDIIYSAQRAVRGRIGKGLEEIKKSSIAGTKELTTPILNPLTGTLLKTESELGAFYAEQPDVFRPLVQALPEESRLRVEKATEEFRKLMATLREMDAASGYEYDEITNYVAHLWKNPPYEVRRVMNELARVRGITGRSAWPTKERVIPTLAEGIRYGLTPELDLAKIAALRLMASVKMAVNKARDEYLKRWADTPEGLLMIRRLPPRGWQSTGAKSGLGVPKGWKPAGAYSAALNGYIIHPELDRAFRNLDALLTDKQMLRDFLNTTERYAAIWKQYVLARPGYHIRNFIGNIVNLVLADVPIQEVVPLMLRARTVLNAAPDALVEVGGRVWRAGDLQTHFMEEGLFGFGGFSEYKNFERELAKLAAKPPTSLPEHGKALLERGLDFSQRIGEVTETNAKMALFLDRLTRGMAPHEAAAEVRKYLFDYHDLTPVERAIRVGVPFYTWTRRQLPLLLEAVFTKPQLYTALGYAKEEAYKATGTRPEDVPTYLQEQMAIPVRGEGGRLRMVSPGLPIDPLAMIKPQDVGSTIGEVLAMLTPLARVPMELAANKQFFSGVPITPREYATTPMFGTAVPNWLAYLLNQVPLPFVGGVGQVGRMVPGAPTGVLEPSSGEPLPPRPPDTPIQQLARALGVHGFALPINPERQREIYRMLYAKRLQDYITHLRRDIGKQVPTIKELRQ